MSWGNNNNNNSSGGWGSNSNSNATNTWGSFGGNTNTNNNNSGFSWGSNTNTNTNTNTNGNASNNNNNSWSMSANNGGNRNTLSPNLINPNKDHMADQPPNDAVTMLRFNPSLDVFAVSSWNNSISCYQYDTGMNASDSQQLKTRCVASQKHDRGVLCCSWDHTGQRLFSGGCDNTVRIWNIENSGNTANNSKDFVTLGTHNAPVKEIQFCGEHNLLVSGSWDRTLAYWDIRSGQKITNVALPAKVFCSAQRGNVLVVGLSNKFVETFDLRKPQQYMSLEKTVLKHQLRCLDVFPDQRGYVVSSVEGRTAIHHFDKSLSDKDFSFKCHRHQKGSDKHAQDVFAVNCVRFNQQFGTFASGGDDGQINIWDKTGRSRLKHFEQIQVVNANSLSQAQNSGGWSSSFGSGGASKVNQLFMPITAVDFNKNGRILAYATSYNWSKGISYYDQKNQVPQLYLHCVSQKEVDPNFKG